MPGLVSNKGFWADLKKPIMALSPMAAITDMAFRRLLVKYAKPDVFFTEFVSVDGLCSSGRENLLGELSFDEDQRPVVAQFFGDKPENFYRCALLAGELGFDGIDINMGCPVKVVCKTGSGASLIDRPELAHAIIQATIEGAGTLPVSVKTRIGNSKIAIKQWTQALLAAGPAAITFHLRTRKEGSKVPAHWEVIHQAVELARETGTLILGNGDVRSIQQAEELAAQTGVDGVLFGRAVCGNPWLFDRSGTADDVSPQDRLRAMLDHARLFEDVFAGKKSFRIMRKHLMAYASGFPGAREVRVSLQQVESAADVVRAVENLRR